MGTTESKQGKEYTYPYIQTTSHPPSRLLPSSFFFVADLKHRLFSAANPSTMDYDFRNKSGPPYGRPMYPSPSPSSTHPMYNGPPGYPKIGGQPFFPPPERNPSFQHNPSPSSSCKSGLISNLESRIAFIRFVADARFFFCVGYSWIRNQGGSQA